MKKIWKPSRVQSVLQLTALSLFLGLIAEVGLVSFLDGGDQITATAIYTPLKTPGTHTAGGSMIKAQCRINARKNHLPRTALRKCMKQAI